MTGTLTLAPPRGVDHAGDVGATIISFGFGHGEPPEAHAIFDVRRHFRDPHVDPSLRTLTGEDSRVIAAVLGTPGIAALVTAVAGTVCAFQAAPVPEPVTVAVGCVGGRHRSAVIAAAAARLLREAGIVVALVHRDIARPVIERPAAGVTSAPETGAAPDGSGVLSPADRREVLGALDTAAEALSTRACEPCEACKQHDSDLCGDHAAMFDQADAYHAVAERLGARGPQAGAA